MRKRSAVLSKVRKKDFPQWKVLCVLFRDLRQIRTPQPAQHQQREHEREAFRQRECPPYAHDAEDAAQDAMVQLWRYLEHIDAERNVEALAVKVAKNCCVSSYRKQQRTTDITQIDPNKLHHYANGISPQEQLEAADTHRILSETLDLLTPRERQLFEMRKEEGLSIDEITQQTGIPKSSVTVMVSVARKKVFTELKRRIKR